MTLADAGYFAASHLAECDRRGQKRHGRFLEAHKDRFTYDGEGVPRDGRLRSFAYSMRTESRCDCTGLQVLSVKLPGLQSRPEPKRLGEAWP